MEEETSDFGPIESVQVVQAIGDTNGIMIYLKKD